jgi:hypothetical protein
MCVSFASIIAGKKFAAAVPDVQSNATVSPRRLAMPNAKKAAERSSTCIHMRMLCCSASAIASGVEREPGQITTWRTPERDSSSINDLTYA